MFLSLSLPLVAIAAPAVKRLKVQREEAAVAELRSPTTSSVSPSPSLPSAAATTATATATATAMAAVQDVDEALYSRQLYVFGHEAQQRMARSRVLLLGLGGLGVEVAKNVVLAGVHSVALLDERPCEARDASANFAIDEAAVRGGLSRATASLPFLQALNPAVHVGLAPRAPPVEQLALAQSAGSGFSVVVVCGSELLSASEQAALSAECSARSVAFVSASASGLFGRCFVDVGAAFTVLDATGEAPARGLLAHVSQAAAGVVTCHEDSRHGLSDGDHVTFEEVEGMTELNDSPPRPVRVLSPFAFAIEDTSAYHPFTGHRGYFQQVIVPRTISTRPLGEQLLRPTLLQQFTCEAHLHALWIALEELRSERGGAALPAPLPPSAVARVALLLEGACARMSPPLSPPTGTLLTTLRRLARVASCELSPMCALMGGVAGQEVLKAVTGKFTPLQQWLYVDASHALPEGAEGVSEEQQEEEEEREMAKSAAAAPTTFSAARLHQQSLVFGAALTARLASVHYFLVGAGAIGCEMLKNLALMGVGRVTVTDMDLIERSNLNRQFLFRSADVGQLKAVVAAREAMRLNPQLHVASHALRVGPDSENVYNDGFWESLDGVITALDNVEARLYVDQRCVYYQRALFDSGTLGSKGSVQTVVPQLTESYGASRDPPEESVPVCTLKNFPNRIEHCIQWAREAFEGHFHSAPATANGLLTDGRAFIDDLLTRPNEALLSLQALHAALVQERPRSVADCVQWARVQFEVEYHHKIAQLLHVFPPASTTSEGVPFWSATKRQPTPLRFDLGDPLHAAYVRSAARLRAEVYNLPWPADTADEEAAVRAAVANASLPPLTVAEVRIATTDAEAKALEEEKQQRVAMEDDASSDRSHDLSDSLLVFREANPTLAPLTVIDFEKVADPPLARYPSSAGCARCCLSLTRLRRCALRALFLSSLPLFPPSLPPSSLPPSHAPSLAGRRLQRAHGVHHGGLQPARAQLSDQGGVAAPHEADRGEDHPGHRHHHGAGHRPRVPRAVQVGQSAPRAVRLPQLHRQPRPAVPGVGRATARSHVHRGLPHGRVAVESVGPHRGQRGARPDAGRAGRSAARALRRGDQHAVVRRRHAVLRIRQQEEDAAEGRAHHHAAHSGRHGQAARAAAQ